jgi:hypothetical protein
VKYLRDFGNFTCVYEIPGMIDESMEGRVLIYLTGGGDN